MILTTHSLITIFSDYFRKVDGEEHFFSFVSLFQIFSTIFILEKVKEAGKTANIHCYENNVTEKSLYLVVNFSEYNYG